MKLYYSPTSPYVRKIMVLLAETGQMDDVILFDSATSPVAPAKGLGDQNPLSKVPALVLDDGMTLYDSRVICAYLDARGGDQLYPGGQDKWATLTLEATGDGILDAALLVTYESRLRPTDKQWADWTDAQWSKIAGACKALDNRWVDHLNGPLAMGQIAVACALGYLDFRHDARNWRLGNDALADWYATFSQRASMANSKPPEG